LVLPLRHDSVSGRFILEPSTRAVVRAVVPGVVTKVYVDEGQSVDIGAALFALRNIKLQSNLAHSQADYSVATGRARAAALHYGNFGSAAKERERLAEQTSQLSSEAASLELKSPIPGVIVTPRVGDRLGAYVIEGTELAEVDDLTQLRARIYVSEHDLYKLHIGSQATLQVGGIFKKWNAKTLSISPVSMDIDPGLEVQTQYKGLRPPNFYSVDLLIANPQGTLKSGMSGIARVHGKRQSLAGLIWQEVTNFVGRKLW
jgi:putative peptide zinc metalloprotease protein